MNTIGIKSGKTRAERKAESRARFARLALIETSSQLEREREIERQRVIRAEYERNHPVSAGLMPAEISMRGITKQLDELRKNPKLRGHSWRGKAWLQPKKS